MMAVTLLLLMMLMMMMLMMMVMMVMLVSTLNGCPVRSAKQGPVVVGAVRVGAVVPVVVGSHRNRERKLRKRTRVRTTTMSRKLPPLSRMRRRRSRRNHGASVVPVVVPVQLGNQHKIRGRKGPWWSR
jgi:uncharacterized membrane protein